MARLNEPAVPIESIDALKRRFVRQNREIARANSTQSLRIRNLESEISRLLAENISLREQNINLTQEVEKYQSSRRLADDIQDVKGRLEAKLAELGGLVEELGFLPTKAEQFSQTRRKSRISEVKRSPDQKNWKNALTLGEVTAGQGQGQDGRLPVIVEDKYYPRRTIDADEFLGMAADNNGNALESPDLGPPPVAHFDETDPIKFDPVVDKSDRFPIDRVDGEDTPPELPPNLERRKKRRDSSLLKDIPSDRPAANSTAEKTISNPPFRSGAKRKLSVRDDEDHPKAQLSETDDFRFSRRNETSSTSPHKAKELDAVAKDLAAIQGKTSSKGKPPSHKEDSTTRRALGPKSTNTGPTSPAKSSKATVSDKIDELKKDVARQATAREQRRDQTQILSVSTTRHSRNNSEENILPSSEAPQDLIDLHPKTPAADLDLFSPTSTEPSAQRPESQDTPPPSDLNPSASAMDTSIRPSRRPRGDVSYAEPNLRDKMRRPTKELVAAVGEDRFQRASSTRAESEEPGKMRTVVVKREESADASSAWKNLAQAGGGRREGEPPLPDNEVAESPLVNKSSGSQEASLPSSVMTDRRRRTSSAPPKGEDLPSADKMRPLSASSAAISALVAGSKRSGTGSNSSSKLSPGWANQSLESRASEKLAIFDGPASSPATGEEEAQTGTKAAASTNAAGTRSATSRPSRRHASNPASLGIELLSKGGLDSKSSTHSRLNGQKQGTEAAPASRDDSAIVSGPSNSNSSLKPAKSVASLDPTVAGTSDGSLRRGAERAASRRRSMML